MACYNYQHNIHLLMRLAKQITRVGKLVISPQFKNSDKRYLDTVKQIHKAKQNQKVNQKVSLLKESHPFIFLIIGNPVKSQFIQDTQSTFINIIMNKLIYMVVSALLYSSNSSLVESENGLIGEAERYRDDRNQGRRFGDDGIQGRFGVDGIQGRRFGDDGIQGRRFRDGGNFIANGNFNFPQLQAEYEITKSIPGWASNEVERGIGSIYNLNWGNTVVVQLDGNQNNVMRQRISLYPGHYTLSFDWAARSQNILTSAMSVYWSGNNIFSVSARDNSVHSARIPIYVGQSGNYVLQIRGEGVSDGKGLTVANFRLTGDRYLRQVENTGY